MSSTRERRPSLAIATRMSTELGIETRRLIGDRPRRAAAESPSLSPGDAYFIAQGTTVTWQVLTPVFQKSFFDYTHPAG
jgi:hypothetical protein